MGVIYTIPFRLPRFLLWPLRVCIVLILMGALLWVGAQLVRYYSQPHPAPATKHHQRTGE